jgi:hypothetical protein
MHYPTPCWRRSSKLNTCTSRDQELPLAGRSQSIASVGCRAARLSPDRTNRTKVSANPAPPPAKKNLAFTLEPTAPSQPLTSFSHIRNCVFALLIRMVRTVDKAVFTP